ncbi:hypothetical protein [Oceanobacillus kapialis]|uniref:Uncharacterized protein n=1 Tax=Oceanobacillus kapialis TaxID=481353 RepID=A0ABW5PXD9_9BACI
MDFLTNNWFISIIGGLIVTGFAAAVKTIRERKYYRMRQQQAKSELFNDIMSFIANDPLPDYFVYGAIYNNISRKHNIKQSDMPSMDEVIEEMIHKIMISPFLPYNDKIEYADNLKYLKDKIGNGMDDGDGKGENNRLFTLANLLLYIVTVLIILALDYVIPQIKDFSIKLNAESDILTLFFILLLTIISIAFLRFYFNYIINNNILEVVATTVYNSVKEVAEVMMRTIKNIFRFKK